MTCDFTSFSTVFQSYQDDGKLIMNAMCNNIQSNFNGSNTFETLRTSSRQELFELVRVNHSARSGGKIDISLDFR